MLKLSSYNILYEREGERESEKETEREVVKKKFGFTVPLKVYDTLCSCSE